MWPDELLYAFQKLNDPIKVSSLHENESAIDMMQCEFWDKICHDMIVAFEMQRNRDIHVWMQL